MNINSIYKYDFIVSPSDSFYINVIRRKRNKYSDNLILRLRSK